MEILGGRAELLLGLDARVSRSEHVVDLAPGDTLLLYSDGLIERRTTDLDHGLSRLADALARDGDLDPEELCDRLLATVGLDNVDDDIALLALRPRGRPA